MVVEGDSDTSGLHQSEFENKNLKSLLGFMQEAD